MEMIRVVDHDPNWRGTWILEAKDVSALNWESVQIVKDGSSCRSRNGRCCRGRNETRCLTGFRGRRQTCCRT